MAFDPQKFLGIISGKGGFSRSAHFELEFVLPEFLRIKYNTEHLTASAISVNIPGITLDTMQVRRGGTTYNESFPVGVTYNDLSVSFLSDGNGDVLNLFKDWVDEIYKVTGIYDAAVDGNSFRIAYRNDYISPIARIRHYNPAGDVIITYELRDLFPQSIRDIPMNWGAYNDMISIPVEFKYRIYTQIRSTTPTIPKPQSEQQPAPETLLPIIPII